MKKKVSNSIIEKKLSKSQKKKIEKILERRRKKSNINDLLKELKKHQLSEEQYSLLTPRFGSISKSLKRTSIDINQQKSAAKIYSSGKKRKVNHEESVNKSLDVIDFNLSSDESELDDINEVSNKSTELNKKLNELESLQLTNENEINIDNILESNNIDNILESNNIDNKMLEKRCSLKKMKKKEKKLMKLNEENIKLIDSHFVPVFRNDDIIEARNKLPIITEESNLIDKIKSNNVVVICGETGSGKTTQLPQFLYEHGFARDKKIVITQPRRVAAIAMSKRIAYEMNLSEEVVSYQIRHEGNATKNTKIKFVTDGVLMKELQKDFLLTDYSVVIIDEAHERTIFSDILIGLISRIIKLREKKGDFLRMVIMSATLRVTDFTENTKLFPTKPPVIQIESRQFPVQIHFSKTTPLDYIKEAYKKVCKIHKEYPLNGNILVFVTGRKEVNLLIKKLQSTFVHKISEEKDLKPLDIKVKEKKRKSLTTSKIILSDLMPKVNFDSISEKDEFNENLSDSESDDEEIVESKFLIKEYENLNPLYCLPLYSMLPEFEQKKVFQPQPKNTRLCIVATNVAETSLTIPNIKYVVDTGKIKNKYFDKTTGISTHVIEWCAKSSANQRSGRSGRTTSGHCFRLYSSAVYNDFKNFPEPEMLKKPLDDLILQLKSMCIDQIQNFPFPTPPNLKSIELAEKRLTILGALENRVVKGSTVSIITSLGKIISIFPVSPRYGKMLSIALHQDLIEFAIAIIACLVVQEIFIYPQKDEQPVNSSLDGDGRDIDIGKNNEDKWAKLYFSYKKWIGTGNSFFLGDVMLMLKACCAAESNNNSFTFCKNNNLRHKALIEIHKLRKQLTREVNNNFKCINLDLNLKTILPDDLKFKKLRQLLLMCFSDHIAKRINNEDLNENNNGRKLKNAYRSIELESPVYMNDKCMLKDYMPEWVVYQEIYENNKLYMRNVVAIEEEWIPIYASNLCKFSKPLEDYEPFYDEKTDQIKCFVTCNFGPFSWKLSKVCIEYAESYEKYKLFAQFLLEGKIFKDLSKYSNEYLSSPKIIVKTWSKLHERTKLFLEAIYENKVCNKFILKRIFKSRPNFLLKEFLQWVPESKHGEVQTNWPPSN